jgi:hypothetical protein
MALTEAVFHVKLASAWNLQFMFHLYPILHHMLEELWGAFLQLFRRFCTILKYFLTHNRACHEILTVLFKQFPSFPTKNIFSSVNFLKMVSGLF